MPGPVVLWLIVTNRSAAVSSALGDRFRCQVDPKPELFTEVRNSVIVGRMFHFTASRTLLLFDPLGLMKLGGKLLIGPLAEGLFDELAGIAAT